MKRLVIAVATAALGLLPSAASAAVKQSGKVRTFDEGEPEAHAVARHEEVEEGPLTFVLQFRDANGKPGPGVLERLRVV